MPRRPYRCLRCYHRFWHAEPFTADKRRVWSWLILLSVLVLFVVAKSTSWLSSDDIAGESSQPQNTSTLSDEKVDAQTSGSEVHSAQNGEASNETSTGTPNRDIPVNEPISKAELEQRLQLARAKSENVRRINQQKQMALAEQTSESPAELQSLLKIDINHRIEEWRKAWQAGDSKRYLSFYSKNFEPSDSVPYNAWHAQRQERVSPSKNIVLVLSEFDVKFSDHNSTSVVTFNQRYVSNNLLEDSRKELVLSKEGEQWAIIAERELVR